MPADVWDDSAPRFRPPPMVVLVVPVVIAFVVQVVGTAAISAWQRVPLPLAAVSIALAAASALALLGARRRPGPTVAVISAVTLADLLVAPDASPPFLALAFAIIGAVVRGARVWAIVSVGVAWLAAIVVAGVWDVGGRPLRIAVTTVGLAACFAIGEGIRRRLDRGRERRAQLNERRRTVEQDERTRIARELHDVLAHSLSQIAVQSGVGLHLFDREPERAREALASIRTLSATGLDEVRGVLSFLRGDEPSPRTAPLTPQPQLADLDALVSQRTGLGLTVALENLLGAERPPGALQTTAYRIAQEALTNVVRHSGASHATVRLERRRTDRHRTEREGHEQPLPEPGANPTGDVLVVIVEDDGTGVSDSAVDGAGIRGMRERAELAGGEIAIAPAPRTGTIVTALLPWPEHP